MSNIWRNNCQPNIKALGCTNHHIHHLKTWVDCLKFDSDCVQFMEEIWNFNFANCFLFYFIIIIVYFDFFYGNAIVKLIVELICCLLYEIQPGSEYALSSCS